MRDDWPENAVVHAMTVEEPPRTVIILCGDCRVQVGVLTADVLKGHQKVIGDTMSKFIESHKCRKRIT